jgi:hypothetical protein
MYPLILTLASNDLLNKKSDIKNAKNALTEKHEKHNKIKNNFEELKKKMKLADSETLTAEAKSQKIQEFLSQEETKSKELDKQLKLLREAGDKV